MLQKFSVSIDLALYFYQTQLDKTSHNMSAYLYHTQGDCERLFEIHFWTIYNPQYL